MIYLYRQPEQDEFLVIGADPAEGGDPSAFVVLSKVTSDVVMVGRSKEESSQMGHTLNHVGKWLEKKTALWPCIAVEKNVGAATLYVLKEHNYPNLFRMPDSFTKTDQGETDQYGWITSTATRPKMLDDLALAIRQKALKIPSKEIVDELFSFIRHAKTGKPQADISSTDDLVMALAIANQLREIQPYPFVDDSELPDDTVRFKGGQY